MLSSSENLKVQKLGVTKVKEQNMTVIFGAIKVGFCKQKGNFFNKLDHFYISVDLYQA